MQLMTPQIQTLTEQDQWWISPSVRSALDTTPVGGGKSYRAMLTAALWNDGGYVLAIVPDVQQATDEYAQRAGQSAPTQRLSRQEAASSLGQLELGRPAFIPSAELESGVQAFPDEDLLVQLMDGLDTGEHHLLIYDASSDHRADLPYLMREANKRPHITLLMLTSTMGGLTDETGKLWAEALALAQTALLDTSLLDKKAYDKKHPAAEYFPKKHRTRLYAPAPVPEPDSSEWWKRTWKILLDERERHAKVKAGPRDPKPADQHASAGEKKGRGLLDKFMGALYEKPKDTAPEPERLPLSELAKSLTNPKMRTALYLDDDNDRRQRQFLSAYDAWLEGQVLMLTPLVGQLYRENPKVAHYSLVTHADGALDQWPELIAQEAKQFPKVYADLYPRPIFKLEDDAYDWQETFTERPELRALILAAEAWVKKKGHHLMLLDGLLDIHSLAAPDVLPLLSDLQAFGNITVVLGGKWHPDLKNFLPFQRVLHTIDDVLLRPDIDPSSVVEKSMTDVGRWTWHTVS